MPSDPLRVLALTRYDSIGASSRVRLYQYLPTFAREGLLVDVKPMITAEMLQSRYRLGHYRRSDLAISYGRRIIHMMNTRQYDLVWLEQEALPWVPASFEKALLGRVPLVLDYDDARFHTYDQHPRPFVRRVLGDKIDQLMRAAALVVVGNPYLEQRARYAGAVNVQQLPSVVNLSSMPPVREAPATAPFTIGWIGSPGSERLLEPLRQVLAPLLLGPRPAARLVLVGASEDALAGLPRDIRPWHEDTEAEEIDRFHVGIMPLEDTPWERGKCGYKLIQYMARGRPVVASPVGVNVDIVREGHTGILAADAGAWQQAFERLRSDPAAAAAMGDAGRAQVEAHYNVAVTAPRLAALIRETASFRRSLTV